MQTFGDLLLLASIIIALIFVPPYLWKQYGGPPIGAWMAEGFVKGFEFILLCLGYRFATDEADRPADRLSASADIDRSSAPQLDKTREALIEFLLYDGWTMTDFRREKIFRGDNNEISAEVEAARRRLGLESGMPRTPIANRPTDAEFAARQT